MLLARCVLLKGRMCTKVLHCNSFHSNTATHRCNAICLGYVCDFSESHSWLL